HDQLGAGRLHPGRHLGALLDVCRCDGACPSTASRIWGVGTQDGRCRFRPRRTARAAAESPSGGRRRYLGGTVWTITEGLLRGQTLILGIIRASGIVARVFGSVSERPKVKHSKCFVRQPRTEGSNPSATAVQEALTSLKH